MCLKHKSVVSESLSIWLHLVKFYCISSSHDQLINVVVISTESCVLYLSIQGQCSLLVSTRSSDTVGLFGSLKLIAHLH